MTTDTSPKTAMERAITSDLKILVRKEAAEIEEQATPRDNPAASAAQTAILEVDTAKRHYETAMNAIGSDQTAAKDAYFEAQPHMVEADKWFAKARSLLIDPIFP